MLLKWNPTGICSRNNLGVGISLSHGPFLLEYAYLKKAFFREINTVNPCLLALGQSKVQT
jgi:hypothetical protein